MPTKTFTIQVKNETQVRRKHPELSSFSNQALYVNCLDYMLYLGNVAEDPEGIQFSAKTLKSSERGKCFEPVPDAGSDNIRYKTSAPNKVPYSSWDHYVQEQIREM